MDAREYSDTSFGKVVDFNTIMSNKEAYADVFSEGSAELKTLLLHLWNNNIQTIACCAGHPTQPYYYKDILFVRKEIDANEYFKHANSRRYHRVEYDSPGYFSFKVNCGGDYKEMKAIKDSIKEELDKVVPSLPSFHMAFGRNDVHNCDEISIYFNYVPNERGRERFFSSLYNVISHTFHLKTATISRNTKPSLESTIAKAQIIHDEQVKSAVKKPQQQREPITPQR